jgi:hypothetical protein
LPLDDVASLALVSPICFASVTAAPVLNAAIFAEYPTHGLRRIKECLLSPTFHAVRRVEVIPLHAADPGGYLPPASFSRDLRRDLLSFFDLLLARGIALAMFRFSLRPELPLPPTLECSITHLKIGRSIFSRCASVRFRGHEVTSPKPLSARTCLISSAAFFTANPWLGHCFGDPSGAHCLNLDAGCDVTRTALCVDGSTPLYDLVASEPGHAGPVDPDVLSRLAMRWAGLCPVEKNFAITRAANDGNAAIVAALAPFEAVVSAYDSYADMGADSVAHANSALEVAAYIGSSECVALLLPFCVGLFADIPALFQASRSPQTDSTTISLLLPLEHNLHTSDTLCDWAISASEGATGPEESPFRRVLLPWLRHTSPLHYAVLADDLELLEHLMSANPPIGHLCCGVTALQLAAHLGRIPHAQLLVPAEAGLFSAAHKTALAYLIASVGSPITPGDASPPAWALAHTLIPLEGHLPLPDESNALMLAAECGTGSVLLGLAQACPQLLGRRNRQGDTALILAMMASVDLDITPLQVEANIPDVNGDLPISFACLECIPRAVNDLLHLLPLYERPLAGQLLESCADESCREQLIQFCTAFEIDFDPNAHPENFDPEQLLADISSEASETEFSSELS